jgi:hypothetical protein
MENTRVAICDNEQPTVMCLQKLLHLNNVKFIKLFESPFDLIKSIENNEYFDLIYMDIEWDFIEEWFGFCRKHLHSKPKNSGYFHHGLSGRLFSKNIYKTN